MISSELKIRVPVPEPIFSVQERDILTTLIPSLSWIEGCSSVSALYMLRQSKFQSVDIEGTVLSSAPAVLDLI